MKTRNFDFSEITTKALKERLSNLQLLIAYANYDTKEETHLMKAIVRELGKRCVQNVG